MGFIQRDGKSIRSINIVVKSIGLIFIGMKIFLFLMGRGELIPKDGGEIVLFGLVLGYLIIVSAFEWVVFGRMFWSFSDKKIIENKKYFAYR